MTASAAASAAHVDVVDVPSRSVFEATVGGVHAGLAAYRLEPGRVVFVHTEIDPAFKGRGIGSALARGALDSVRASGMKAVPLCPFIRAWIGRHPGYEDLVDPDAADRGEPS